MHVASLSLYVTQQACEACHVTIDYDTKHDVSAIRHTPMTAFCFIVNASFIWHDDNDIDRGTPYLLILVNEVKGSFNYNRSTKPLQRFVIN